jgi:oligopeptide/dipeptide ABC transporter ATP-binding protein
VRGQTFVLSAPVYCLNMNGSGRWAETARRMASILEVQDLHVSYQSRKGAPSQALAGVSFHVMHGEILGVLGESGSGKSTLAASLLRLLHSNGKITKGAVLFEDRDILQANANELQQIRGKRISLIFQEPSVALHPTMRAGEQVRQVLAAHEPAGKIALRDKTKQVLSTVFPKDTERISRSYPHQLSGGQRQRLLIAQAIACGPSLVIADEPTASLDPTTQAEILGVFRALREKLGLAMILITHNPAVLAGLADRVLVLYGGRVAELGPAGTVLTSPRHPYTRALFQSIPTILEVSDNARKKELPAIPGDSLSLPPEGCPFEPRCPERMPVCWKREPELIKVNDAHTVSCFLFESQTNKS